jgi:hypothetical protein
MTRIAPRWVVGLAMLIAIGVCSGAPARAQSAPRPHIGLVERSRLPGRWSDSILRELRTRYDVSRIAHSGKRPTVRALRRAIEAAEVSAVLLVSRQGRMLKLEYVDAETGRRLGITRISVRGPELSRQTERKLLAATARYVGRTSVAAREENGVAATERTPSARRAAPAPLSGDMDESDDIEDAAGASDMDDDELAAEDDQDSVAEEPAVAQPGDDESKVQLTLIGGIGSSVQSGEIASDGISAQFDAGRAFALGLGARLQLGARSRSHWLVEGRYATSVGREVEELHMGGAPQSMGLRNHRLEGGVGPRLALGGAGWWLTPTLGYALRSVVPEVHFQLLPFYTLGGPYLRVELALPLIGTTLGLRFSPELQWLLQASTRVGGSSLTAGRFALAGQLALVLQVNDAIDLELFMHESHAFADTSGLEVNDMERFVLANVAWRP